MHRIKIAVLADSPKIHTGFGTVNERLCAGFHEAGFDVHAIGLLDHKKDTEKKLPYAFYPVAPMDDLGHKNFDVYIRKIQPNVIFILTDPGNLWNYIYPITTKPITNWFRDGRQYQPVVVSYTPIEGSPSPYSHGESLTMVEGMGGTTVVYCESARKMITKEFPNLDPKIVWHGLDHAPFKKYSNEDRKILRKLVGLDDYFVVGSVGVNKRTKGFTTLIYAAQILREQGRDKGIKFYCHTNPRHETMHGFKLLDLAKQYGVGDMFLWKQEVKFVNSYWVGVDRDAGTLEMARNLVGKTPPEPEQRGFLWTRYDFVSKLNCLDLYVDASQIEGWGLPVMESMACGIPVVSVNDGHVREELHRGASYMLPAEPRRLWETWHSGMRLAVVDPSLVADAIIDAKCNEAFRNELSIAGQAIAKKYKWADSQKKMNKIVKDTYERYFKEWQNDSS